MRPERRGWSPVRTAWVGRACIVLFMLVAAAISPQIANFPGLFHYLQSALAYLVPPVAVVFMFALFWRGATATGAFATLLGGHAVSAVLFTLSLLEIIQLHFTLVAGLLALISAVILLSCSPLGDRPRAEQVARYTFHGASAAATPGMRRWQDYRLYAVLLVVLASALVAAHW